MLMPSLPFSTPTHSPIPLNDAPFSLPLTTPRQTNPTSTIFKICCFSFQGIFHTRYSRPLHLDGPLLQESTPKRRSSIAFLVVYTLLSQTPIPAPATRQHPLRRQSLLVHILSQILLFIISLASVCGEPSILPSADLLILLIFSISRMPSSNMAGALLLMNLPPQFPQMWNR